MFDNVHKLLFCFPHSFINNNFEFIADIKTNSYFPIEHNDTLIDFECKVLEFVSRASFKSEPFKAHYKNTEHQDFLRDCINKYLETDFTREDMELIYTYLGNRCNHKLTQEFVLSYYDMDILKRKREQENENI